MHAHGHKHHTHRRTQIPSFNEVNAEVVQYLPDYISFSVRHKISEHCYSIEGCWALGMKPELFKEPVFLDGKMCNKQAGGGAGGVTGPSSYHFSIFQQRGTEACTLMWKSTFLSNFPHSISSHVSSMQEIPRDVNTVADFCCLAWNDQRHFQSSISKRFCALSPQPANPKLTGAKVGSGSSHHLPKSSRPSRLSGQAVKCEKQP